MRWDELQLLHLVDDLETNEQIGVLMNGYSLLQAAADGKTIDLGPISGPILARASVSGSVKHPLPT